MQRRLSERGQAPGEEDEGRLRGLREGQVAGVEAGKPQLEAVPVEANSQEGVDEASGQSSPQGLGRQMRAKVVHAVTLNR